MADALKAAATRQLPAFRLGEKRVFLPNHVITFLRKEHLPPNEACFQVPLRFTKFDLRDYLWNLYNVQVKTVRSYVKAKPLAERPGRYRSMYRPQPLKIMTVELKEPFQWPEVPTDKEPWSNALWEMREKQIRERKDDQYNQANRIIPMVSRQGRSPERKSLAGMAKALLSGNMKWSNDVELDPRWDAIVAANPAKPGKAKVKETVAEKATLQTDAKEHADRTEPKQVQ